MPSPDPSILEQITTRELVVPIAPTRSSTLKMGPDVVSWGVHRVSLDAVVDLRYVSRFESTALWQQRLVRRVVLQAADESIELALGREAVTAEASAEQADAYLTLVDHLHRTLEPRLRRRAVERLRSGASIDCGRVALSVDGLLIDVPGRRSRNLVAWERLPSAHFERDVVEMYADSPDGSVLVGKVSMMAPHAVLLPELLDDALTAFG